MNNVVPIHGTLPYPGPGGPNSGFSGSDTSEERARRQDADGTTGLRQRQVMRLLGVARDKGVTWREVAAALSVHHGAASGALSNLHKEGAITRLTIRRDRCKIYVLPAYVGERAEEAQGRSSHTSLLIDVRALLGDVARVNVEPVTNERIDQMIARIDRQVM